MTQEYQDPKPALAAAVAAQKAYHDTVDELLDLLESGQLTLEQEAAIALELAPDLSNPPGLLSIELP